MSIQFQLRDYCPVCDCRSSTTLYDIPFASEPINSFIERFYQGRVNGTQLAAATFLVLKCNQCKFIYQGHILNETGMAALYGKWVDSATSLKKKQAAKSKLYRQYAAQIGLLSRIFPQPPHLIKILEFGMGWGYWSRMAKAHGYQVEGLELSPERAAYARAMGINVIDSLPSEQNIYHFIYANQVFEHLPEPLATLQDLVSRLRPEGLIYLRVPDGRKVEKQLLTAGWAPNLDAIHPLEHINCFTRSNLIELAARAGLETVQPPARLNLNTLWPGIKRELADRFFTTHVFFKRA